MSWSFNLCDPVTRQVLKTEEKHFMFGGTVAIGGSNSMDFDITYNYSGIINKAMNNNTESYVHVLNGKTGAESIPILKDTISKLGDDVDEDYWKATEGNAKRALCALLAFAQMRPDGVWNIF